MHRRLRAALAVAASTVALGALAAPAAHAGILADSCGDADTTQAFAQFGDPAHYTLVPGGTFEAGSAAWTMNGGAAVQSGNERYYVNSESDERSLSLPAGSSATSPAMCTSIHRPTIRFFARNTGSRLSNLRVEVISQGLLGSVKLVQLGLITGSNWTPSLPLPVVANLLAVLGGDNTSLTFRFSPIGASGRWSIDDVYVDPPARR